MEKFGETTARCGGLHRVSAREWVPTVTATAGFKVNLSRGADAMHFPEVLEH